MRTHMRGGAGRVTGDGATHPNYVALLRYRDIWLLTEL